MSNEKHYGVCKRFNANKGFGFITDSATGEDFFVHHTAIYGDGFRTLGEGEEVEYNVQMDDEGRLKAINVTGPKGNKVVGDQRGRMYGSGNNETGGGGYRNRNSGGGDNPNNYNSSHHRNDGLNNGDYNSYRSNKPNGFYDSGGGDYQNNYHRTNDQRRI